MQIPFSKYQGNGNDFILIDNRTNTCNIHSDWVKFLCTPRWGVGADGLIEIKSAHGTADFEMVFYNPDGSSGMMCGNGGRCAIAWAAEHNIGKENVCFLNQNQRYNGKILSTDGVQQSILLTMPPSAFPKKYNEDWLMDTGSPHYISFVSKKTFLDIPVAELGKDIRYAEPFLSQGGINVNYVAVLETNTLFVRTYERGVERETLSCGTGATASALCYAFVNKMSNGEVLIHSKGGELRIRFHVAENEFTDITLQGSVIKTFCGEVDSDSLLKLPIALL